MMIRLRCSLCDKFLVEDHPELDDPEDEYGIVLVKAEVSRKHLGKHVQEIVEYTWSQDAPID